LNASASPAFVERRPASLHERWARRAVDPPRSPRLKGEGSPPERGARKTTERIQNFKKRKCIIAVFFKETCAGLARKDCGAPLGESVPEGKNFATITPLFRGMKNDARSSENPLRRRFGLVTVEVREADISRLAVEAVVNAANNVFWMGGGVAGALKRAGGARIEKEAMALGPRPVGEVVVTGAGTLPAKHVIHAAVMGQDLRTDASSIAMATRNTLLAAEKLGAVSLALPAFGTGVGGFPLEECARVMLGAVSEFAPGARSVRTIVFALFGPEARESFEKILESLPGDPA